MSRMFRRGELRSALLHVLAGTGPATGYTVMQNLAEHVGGGWRPSPGAIYPALLALEDAGLVTGRDTDDGTRTYRLTTSGDRMCEERPDLLAALAERRPSAPGPSTLGDLLDDFARRAPHRAARLDPRQIEAITATLQLTRRRIADDLDQGSNR